MTEQNERSTVSTEANKDICDCGADPTGMSAGGCENCEQAVTSGDYE